MKMEKAKEATARKAEKARIESFASDPRPPPLMASRRRSMTR